MKGGQSSHLTFFIRVFFASLVALLVGRLVEKLVEYVQDGRTDKTSVAFALVFQIFIIISLLFIGDKFITVYKKNFDSWLFETFDGYLVSFVFAATQQALADNARILF